MTLSAVSSVIRLAKSKVINYLAIFLIIMFGFGTAGFIIYGDKIPAYGSIFRGSLEMILATLGGIQYTEMKAINAWITPFFAFSYLIFANTVFLKTFLLIIQEEYNDYFAAYSKTGSDLVTMIINGCDVYTKELEVSAAKYKRRLDDLNEQESQKWLGRTMLQVRRAWCQFRLYMLKGRTILLGRILAFVKAGSQFENIKSLEGFVQYNPYKYDLLDDLNDDEYEDDDYRFTEIRSLKMFIGNFSAGHIKISELNNFNPSVWMSELSEVISNDALIKVGLEFKSGINHYDIYQQLTLFTHREQVSLVENLFKLEWRKSAAPERVLQFSKPDKFKSLLEAGLVWEDRSLESEFDICKFLINLYLYLVFKDINISSDPSGQKEKLFSPVLEEEGGTSIKSPRSSKFSKVIPVY